MMKLRVVLAAVLLATGCTPPPQKPAEPTAEQKAAAPQGSCFCKSSSCLCSHCSTGKGECTCKR